MPKLNKPQPFGFDNDAISGEGSGYGAGGGSGRGYNDGYGCGAGDDYGYGIAGRTVAEEI